MKILIAEDDQNMSKILRLYLQREGYEVECVSDGEAVLDYFENRQADLLLLDLLMPKKDGLETCRELRLMKIPVKIIMLTAKTASDHEYQGLSVGADDYIRKPFDIKVLLEGTAVDLTKKEFELLQYFLANQNIVLSREKILDYVWGMDYDGDIRTVDTHVRRLRKKIGDSYIQTVFGIGYILGGSYE